MGVLRIVEVLNETCEYFPPTSKAQLADTAASYERRAVQGIVSISKKINEVSADDAFKFSDVFEDNVPLILHHANTGLTVMALVKGIEHAISSSGIENAAALDAGGGFATVLNSDLKDSLHPLLICLSTLQQTVSGECIARPALQDLLFRHGDILLECWNQDEVWT
jgi:hypothetical protein